MAEFTWELSMSTTTEITQLIEDALASPRLTPDAQSKLGEYYPKSESVPVSVIHSALALARNPEKPNSGPWLHEILRHSHVALPKRPVRQKDPELVKRLQKIQCEIDNREYAGMVKNLTKRERKEAERDNVGKYLDDLSIGGNFIITLGTCFCIGYFIGRSKYSDDESRIFCGLAGLILALLIETILFMIRSDKAARIEDQKKKKKLNAPGAFTAGSEAVFNLAADPAKESVEPDPEPTKES
jgi:hypothetical protein